MMITKLFLRDRKDRIRAFPGSKLETYEAFQLAHRTDHFTGYVTDIQLNRFDACAIPGVRYVHADLKRLIGRYLVSGQFQLAVFKRRIG
ncbi:hypothetical protein BGX30_005677 [Mortierella sp. GBA39]|nr:hypothetical protein BGX30_005677 [Mortierella sp. GBA39]